MGKLSGLITAAALIGIVAILIYFCCRLKKKRMAGAGGNSRWSDVFFKQNQQDGREDTVGIPPGHGSYPQQQHHHHQADPNMSQAPHSIVNPYAQSFYPPGPYPGNNAPYPIGNPINMPMPLGQGVSYDRSQATAPPSFTYPTPSGRPDDLPPPYHEAVMTGPPQRY